MAQVFISYTHADKNWVQLIAQAIADERLSVWWDDDTGVGEKIPDSVEAELRSASAVVVVWSEQSINSGWVADEARDAQKFGSFVPILKDDVEPPRGLREFNCARLIGWNGEHDDPEFRKMMDAIQRRIASGAARRAETQPSPTRRPRPVPQTASAPAAIPAGLAPKPHRNRWLVPSLWAGAAILAAGLGYFRFGMAENTNPGDATLTAANQAEQIALANASKGDRQALQAMAAHDRAEQAAQIDTQTPIPSQPLDQWTYAGQRTDETPNGNGVQTFANAVGAACTTAEGRKEATYSGEFQNGVKSGLGVWYHCSGYVYKGEFAQDRPNGFGVSTKPDGTTYRGAFVTGGTTFGVTLHPDKAARQEIGHIGAGGLEGPGALVCADQTEWRGQWSQGAPQGTMSKFDAAGTFVATRDFGATTGAASPCDARP